MTNLKQCLFCASTNLRIEETSLFSCKFAVFCYNCGSRGQNTLSKENAAKMWNMRRDKMPNEKGFLFTEEQEKK